MANHNIRLRDKNKILYPEVKVKDLVDSATASISVNTFNAGLVYTTTDPTGPNTEGLKIAVLDHEPMAKYDGWLYIVTEA